MYNYIQTLVKLPNLNFSSEILNGIMDMYLDIVSIFVNARARIDYGFNSPQR